MMTYLVWYLVGCALAAYIHLETVKRSGAKRVKLLYFILTALASWAAILWTVLYVWVPWDITFVNPLGYSGPSEATRIEALRRRHERIKHIMSTIKGKVASISDFDNESKEVIVRYLDELGAIIGENPELTNGDFQNQTRDDDNEK